MLRGYRNEVLSLLRYEPCGIEMSDPLIKIQAKQCSTCIYRKDSSLDIQRLEAQIADPRMKGFFTGWRECHHAKRGSGVCCRGFWNRHRNDFTLGQVAQRLSLFGFVEEKAK